MGWFFFALASAVLFGLHYVFLERILQRIPISVVYVWGCIVPGIATAAYFWLTSRPIGPATIVQDRTTVFLFLGAQATLIAAGLCVLSAVSKSQNAALASLIQISYPLFIVAFSWLIYQEAKINALSIMGAVLIAAGVVLVSRAQA